MNFTRMFFAVCFAASFSMNADARELISESFESADMSLSSPEGFTWEDNNRTSVVFGDGTRNVAVWNNGPRNNEVDRDWQAWDGDHSLRFIFPAGENWSEQRYNLGTPQTDIWYSYYIRVPLNYYHCDNCARANNKFFAVWMDGYETSGDGSTFWMNMLSGGNGNSDIALSYSQGGNTNSGGFQQQRRFITVPQDRGRWMEIVVHLTTESSDGANDGVIEVWRRWTSESDFTQLHSLSNAGLRIPDNGPRGFIRGYFLGWANGPYSEDTEWLIDNITISTSSLLETGPKPNPPVISAQ
ncbi:MAG: hypothetical protein AAGL69_06855 [Pseudomonadota bacterium]